MGSSVRPVYQIIYWSHAFFINALQAVSFLIIINHFDGI